MQARINLFFTWFFIPQTLAMGWVAAAGNGLLELLGAPTPIASVWNMKNQAANMFKFGYFITSLPTLVCLNPR